MRKLKLLLMAFALLGGASSANAQSWTGNAPAAGKFFLYNVGANKFINNGDPNEYWGTNAYLQAGFGLDIQLEEVSSGGYYLNTNVKNNNTDYYLGTSTWCDGAATAWIFTAVDGQANTYTISNDNKYLVANDALNDIVYGDLTNNSRSWWKLVSLDDFKAAMQAHTYSTSDPMDVSVFIQGRSFARNDERNNSWTTNHDGGNWVWIGGTEDNKYYGNETWHNTFNVYQNITNLPAGTYELKCSGFGTNGTTYIYATTGGVTTKKAIQTDNYTSYGDNKEAKWKAIHEDNAFADQTTGTFVVGNGSLTVGIKRETDYNYDWCIYDEFRLYYYGLDLSEFAASLAEAVDNAEALEGNIPEAAYTALSGVVTQYNQTWTTVAEYTTAITNINTAVTAVEAMVEPYDAFYALKDKANDIAGVLYTETTSGSHETFENAISDQKEAVEKATTADAITTAINDLKAAIKTYVNNAEPQKEGEYFDITCLIENPSFDNNDATGWSGTTPGFEAYQNAEFFNKNFDFYQNITGLANGSYQLSVQAFCRPGDNGNETAGAYYDFTQGTNNITAELYVNSDASTIGNIYSYKGNTTGAKVAGNDFHCNISPDDYWVPNNMKGAGLYFEDGAYETTVAALVEDGNLKIGFREENKKNNQWVIFDNFRLYFFGSSKLVYYQQYLPQLKAEVTEDLANATYDNVQGKERGDLTTANAATPASETETAYKNVIDDIKTKQTAFKTAKPSYDALFAAKAYDALDEITDNIGSGVFQHPASTTTKWAAYSEAKTDVDNYTVNAYSTAAAVQELVDALDDAIADYQPCFTLNAPDPSKHYNIIVATAEHAKNGNAIVLGRIEYPHYSGTYIDNQTGFTLNASATPNVNLAQACVFTPVSGKANTYYISMERTEGIVYLTYGSLNDSKVNWKADQIQATTDASKKGEFKIAATATANQFNILNTANDNPDNEKIACQPNGNIYTAQASENAFNYTIAEASEASVNVKVPVAQQYATRIFPFAPTLPSGIKAYSCAETVGGVLTLAEVASPAANTPYILELTAENAIDNNLVGWGTAASLDAKTDGLLTGVYEEQFATAGTYVLQNNNDKVAFYRVADGKEPIVGAYRCYLTEPSGNGSGEARDAFFFDEGEATAIDAINALTSGDAQIFNAAGAQLPSLQKGMNILQLSNGKSIKVMVNK